MMSASEVRAWLDTRLRENEIRVAAIAFADSREWRFDSGRLVHRSGRFFAVVGTRIRARLPRLDGLAQPMIDQPEVGILGFLARRESSGYAWLCQAKAEPGNVGGVQIAPTVQATYSNYTQVHGGRPTPYLEWFTRPGRELRSDILQSEQGTAFVSKYNRNAVALCEDVPDPVSEDWRWVPAECLKQLVGAPHIVNTDARSVLVCSPWSLLADQGGPFARWEGSGGVGEDLLNSYRASDAGDVRTALAALDRERRAHDLELTRCALSELPNWHVRRSTIDSPDHDQRVEQYAVTAPQREVACWDQPLIASDAQEHILLIGERRGPVLGFLLSASLEPGFDNGVQFGPTARSGAAFIGDDAAQQLLESTVPLASTVYSDEGGRFMKVLSQYEVRLLRDESVFTADPTLTWVSLGTIEQLARRQGVLNNELRSAVALLLQWA